MTRPIASLRNLGPATAADLALVGISDEAVLRDVGAIEAYRRLKMLKPRHYSVVGLCALHGALADCRWDRLPDVVREDLREEAARIKPRSDESPRDSRKRARRRSGGA